MSDYARAGGTPEPVREVGGAGECPAASGEDTPTSWTTTTRTPKDPKIIEKAADAIGPGSCTCLEGPNEYGYWRRFDMSCPACGDSEAKARAALEAVADDLRAEVRAQVADEIKAATRTYRTNHTPPSKGAVAFAAGMDYAATIARTPKETP